MHERSKIETTRSQDPHAFRVDGCLVVPSLNRIERQGEVISIEPRVMQVLVRLAEVPGRVLSRQELFESVWTDALVCEEALTRTITELRRVFRDDRRQPRVIETIRKGGYRLIAPVAPVGPAVEAERESEPSARIQVVEQEMGAPTPAEAVGREPLPEPKRGRGLGRAARAAGIALVSLGFLTAVVWNTRHPDEPPRAVVQLLDVVPITSFPGLELFPDLSPNGAMLAFSWSGEGPTDIGALDLYVMQLPSGRPTRLVEGPGSVTYPSWSPDGTEIAFALQEASGSTVATVEVLGGEVRHLHAVSGSIEGLDWSPDGEWIVLATTEKERATPELRLLRRSDLTIHSLHDRPPEGWGDFAPVFSPDSRTVAFLRGNDRGEQDAWVVPVAAGPARMVALEGRRVSGIAWLGPEELALSATSKLDVGLWSVHTDSGRRTLLALPGGRVQRLSYAASARRLAFEKLSYTRAIKSVALSPSRAGRSKALRIASTQRDWEAVFSPDGTRLVFVSDRAGSSDLWLADSSGGAQRRLTHQRADLVTQPRWSPDGTRVVFSSGSAGVGGVAVVDVATQIVRALPLEGSFAVGAWSQEGDYLYACRTTEAGVELWRFHPDGSGAARFGRDGLEIVDASPDRPGLICRDLVDRAIVFLPFDGGAEEVLVGSDRSRAWHEVSAVSGGFYLTRRSSEASTLAYFDLATGKETPLTTLEWYAASLAVAPNRSVLLYDCIQGLEIDLMLTEMLEGRSYARKG